MATFGPVTFDETIEVQAICVGPGGTVFSESVFIEPTCATCTITSQPQSAAGAEGDPFNFGGTASGPIQWFTGPTATGPWSPVTAPPSTITAVNNDVWWRFCCVDNPALCSDSVTTFVAGNLTDRTAAVPDGGTVTEVFCAGCPADWEIRVFEPDDQFNSPDPDPGDPSNANWVTVTEVSGLDCIEMAIDEQFLDGVNPDTQGAPNEELFLHIRATCGGTVQNATLTIEI